ncbi:MFS transporter [Corynebacterium pyruviciproducens]
MTPSQTHRLPFATMLICGSAVAYDGYDLITYGATLREISAEWALTKPESGLIGSVALIGMFFGAIIGGSIAPRFERKHVFIGCVFWFSIFMFACAFAHGPVVFAILRFLNGFGLGALLPIAAAITQESAPEGKKNLAYVSMQSGYPLGGVAASLVAMWVLAHYSWHWMYLIGALPLVTIIPAAMAWLPNTGHQPSRAGDGLRIVFAPQYRRSTVVFWIMSFSSLLFVYGANTWLPSLMRESGHSTTSALGFLLAFNAGGIVGGLVGGWACDHWQPTRIVSVSFLVGALAVALFTTGTNTLLSLGLAALAGYGAVGTQTLINSWATRFYPAAARTTGVGWVLGMGRIGGIIGPYLTGVLIVITSGGTSAFLLFSGIACVGACLAFLVKNQAAAHAEG